MSDTAAHLSNSPALSVSELSRTIKSTLEDRFGRVRVRGEIISLARPQSGHLYFSLSDPIDDSRLQAVCFRGAVSRLNHQPQDGDEVIVEAKLTAYGARSQYQLVVSQIGLAGVGALLKMLETRRQKLAAEGLFDTARKRPVPMMPRLIGVITSEKGAVWQDILHRLEDRCPAHVLLWSTLVQGEGAGGQICAAIAGMNALPPGRRPEVLIVARGGGSMEDLMPFQQEEVVRAVAASQIPIVSAIGHETDTTLIDYVADLRAPTPTAAVEMVVPVRRELLKTLSQHRERLQQHLERHTDNLRLRLREYQRFFSRIDDLLVPTSQRLDMVHMDLVRAMMEGFQRQDHRLGILAQRLRSPGQILSAQQHRLSSQAAQLPRLIGQRWRQQRQQLDNLQRLLRNSSHESTLERGFVLVQDAQGQLVRRAQQLVPDSQLLTLRFVDGSAMARTTAKAAAKSPVKSLAKTTGG